MSRLKKWIISCIFTGMVLFLFGCGSEEIAKDVYVEAGQSLQEALDEAKPGQTIWVREGIYEGPFEITESGTAEERITICAYPGERVLLTNADDTEGGVVNFYEVSYVTLSGFAIGEVTGRDVCGIYLENNDSYVTIENNDIYGLVTTDLDNESDGGANGILLYGDGETEKAAIRHILIQNNKVHDNINGWCENISIAGNVESVQVLNNEVYHNTNIGIDFYGNAGYCPVEAFDQPRLCEAKGNQVYDCLCPYAECAGIYVDGARDIVLEANICHDNAYGIEVGCEEGKDDYPVKNIVVTDNEIYENTHGGIRVGGYAEAFTGWVTDTVIKRNYLRDNANGEGGYNGELNFSKVDGILVEANEIHKADTRFPMIGGGDVSAEYTKNVRFVENVYYSNGNPEEISFEFKGKSLSGITQFNEYTGGNDEAYRF